MSPPNTGSATPIDEGWDESFDATIRELEQWFEDNPVMGQDLLASFDDCHANKENVPPPPALTTEQLKEQYENIVKGDVKAYLDRVAPRPASRSNLDAESRTVTGVTESAVKRYKQRYYSLNKERTLARVNVNSHLKGAHKRPALRCPLCKDLTGIETTNNNQSM